MQVLACSSGARLLTVHFSPRSLTFSSFVGKMRLLASLISFVVSFSSGWKDIMTINFSLSFSLEFRGFDRFPPVTPVPFAF